MSESALLELAKKQSGNPWQWLLDDIKQIRPIEKISKDAKPQENK